MQLAVFLVNLHTCQKVEKLCDVIYEWSLMYCISEAETEPTTRSTTPTHSMTEAETGGSSHSEAIIALITLNVFLVHFFT